MGEFRVHHVRFFEYQPKAIHCISYSQTAKRVAISRTDGTIEIWSVADHWYQEKIIRNPEDTSIEALCWQGQRLFTASLNGCVTEYDLLRLQPKATVSSNAGPVWCLTSDPTEKYLAAGTEEGCVVIFDTELDGLEYKKSFDKQEGRILCIAWHKEGEVIVTGGVDNIRLWSVNSGHAVQRLIPGRTENKEETIIWCVAILSDMTIVSGDSRGKTCFWNGRQGTLMKSFQSHKSDVFCLCVEKSERSVFTSGVHPLVAQFEYVSTQAESDWKVWVATKSHGQHTHDVRALEVVEDSIVSGGVDTNIIIKKCVSKKGQKDWRRIAAIPQHSLVQSAKEAGLIALQYHTYIEVWKLGHTNKTSDINGEILPLVSKPLKLLQLEGKSGEPIICFAFSNHGNAIAISDNSTIRIYSLKVEDKGLGTPEVSLKKCKSKPITVSQVIPAHKMVFCTDGTSLVTATCCGRVQVLNLDNDMLTDVHTLPLAHDTPQSITHLCLTSDGDRVAIADCKNNITIYSIPEKQVLCHLPHYKCQACSMAFSPSGEELVVTYTDQMIYEFSVQRKEFTAWCKKYSSKFHHPQWKERYSKINHVTFQEECPNKIFLNDEQMICIVDKSQRLPSDREQLYSKQTWEGGSTSKKGHAFHICGKYKFIMHVDVLKDNWLVVVERPPITIMESLPLAFKMKKFGT